VQAGEWIAGIVSMHRNARNGFGHSADAEDEETAKGLRGAGNTPLRPETVADPARFFALSFHLFLIADTAGTIRKVNPAWTEVLGFDASELVGTSFLELVHPEDLGPTRAEMERLERGIDTERFENRYRCRNGAYRYLVWSASEDPTTGLIYAVAHDVTEHKCTEEELRYRAELERALVEVSNDLLTRSSGELSGVIDRALENVGLRFRADRSYLFLLEEETRRMCNTNEWCAAGIEPQIARLQDLDIDAFPEWFSKLRRREVIDLPRVEVLSDAWESERRLLAAQGIQSLLAVPVEVDDQLHGFAGFDSVRELRDWTADEARVLRFLGNLIGGAIARSRTEKHLKESQGKLERIAYYDPLTKLPNRRLLLDRIRQCMTVADRNQTLLAVCYLDLDGFKPVNDSYGHETGDELLVSVSERLARGIRAGDTVARWGGDEFAILLTDFVDADTCREVLERLLRLVAEPHCIGEREFVVTASIGVTLYPRDHADADSLLRHADQALYLSKEQGRNTYRYFDPAATRRRP
jgi:diguanylate cyclase (GGDEF)-like protein/PAS domain S-box-containing protein